MVEFVAPPVRKLKRLFGLADTCELGRQIDQLVRHDMDDQAFPLHPAFDRQHVRAVDNLALRFLA